MMNNPHNTHPPGIGQYALGIILGILALAAGGISLTINYAFGMQTSLFVAAVFVISDLAKMVLPATTAALGSWSQHRKICYGVAVSISVMAAVSYLLETQADRLLAAQSQQQKIAGATTDAARLRRELASISEPMDAAVLQNLANETKAAADREGLRGSCGPICESLKHNYAMLLGRLGEARRRIALERQLAENTRVITASKAEAIGAANTIALLTGGDKDQIATYEAVVKSCFMLAVLELLAALSGSAGTMIVTTWRTRQAVVRKPKLEEAEILLQPAEKPAKSTRGYWLERLCREAPETAAKVLAGEISCYKGCIAAGLRKGPATQRNAKTSAKRDWSRIEAYEGANC